MKKVLRTKQKGILIIYVIFCLILIITVSQIRKNIGLRSDRNIPLSFLSKFKFKKSLWAAKLPAFRIGLNFSRIAPYFGPKKGLFEWQKITINSEIAELKDLWTKSNKDMFLFHKLYYSKNGHIDDIRIKEDWLTIFGIIYHLEFTCSILSCDFVERIAVGDLWPLVAVFSFLLFFFLKSFLSKKPLKLDSKTLDSIVGIYQISENDFRTVTREGDQLYTQKKDGPRLPVYAESETKFFYKDSFHFTIVKDENGKVMKMIMHLPSGDEEAIKTDRKLEV